MKKQLAHKLMILFLVLTSGCQTSPETVEPSLVKTPTATAATVPSQTFTKEPSPTATEKVMTLEEKVDAFATGKIEFPANMSPEEYKAFIKEMNDRRGSSAIWTNSFDANGKPVITYHNTLTNKIEVLPGTYEENKAIIEQNTTTTFVEIYIEPGTNNLQYVDPKTGKIITVPNSAGVSWKPLDSTNYKDGTINLPILEKDSAGLTLIDMIVAGWDASSIAQKSNLVLTVLTGNRPTVLTFDQGAYFEYNCLEMLFIRTDANGRPIYAVKAYVGAQGSTQLAREGGTGLEEIRKFRLTKDQDKLIPGGLYYVAISPEQDLIWKEMNRATINSLENTASEDDAYNAAVNDEVPADANVILTTPLIIEKNQTEK